MSHDPNQVNGWGEWSKHVLKELERLNGEIRGLNDACKKIQIDIAMLQVKSGLWGALGALIPIILFMIFKGE